jgi:hypothetical protein
MLAVFVPQSCPASANVGQADTCDGCTCEVIAHDCSFSENFRCLTQFNQFVLAWNFICLALLIFHYFLVWRRENFIISNFKETLTLGRLHVRDIIADYPTVQIRLRKYNRWVFNTSCVAILFQLVNVTTSAVLLFGYYSDGYKTFTVSSAESERGERGSRSRCRNWMDQLLLTFRLLFWCPALCACTDLLHQPSLDQFGAEKLCRCRLHRSEARIGLQLCRL